MIDWLIDWLVYHANWQITVLIDMKKGWQLKDNEKCSIGENEISQKQSDNKLRSSKSSQSSGNNSDEWDRPTIAKDFSSEPCPHLLVFNSYKNDTLPISNIFATDFNRDNKSISRTTKATIDEGR